MKIIFENGIKWKGDRKTILQCPNCYHSHDLNYSELACMYWSLYWNEQIGYPPPRYLGGLKLSRFLDEVTSSIPNIPKMFNSRIEPIMKKYQFPKIKLPIIEDRMK